MKRKRLVLVNPVNPSLMSNMNYRSIALWMVNRDSWCNEGILSLIMTSQAGENSS